MQPTIPIRRDVTHAFAKIVTGPLAWGNTTLRAGEIGFIASRAFSEGAAGALYTVEMAAAGDDEGGDDEGDGEGGEG